MAEESVSLVREFGNQHVFPVLQILERREYEFPEIQKVHDDLVSELIRRYRGNKLQIYLVEAPGHSSGLMGCHTQNGFPVIEIRVFALMNLFYEDCQQSVETFQTIFVTAFLHEMIHLAHALVANQSEGPNRSHMYDAERIAWAKTCEEVMRPFIERGRHYCAEQCFYDAWVRCNRSQLSRWWKKFIEEQYKNVPLGAR